MKRSTRSVIAISVIGILAVFGTVGCMTYQGPSQADFDRVNNDPNLSQDQKDEKMEQLADSANYYAPNYLLIGSLLVLAVGLYVGGTAVRRRMENGESGRKGRPAKASSSKPQMKKSSAPAPAPPAAQSEPVFKLPETQDEIDALPFEERGTSFFTARPAPASALVYADIEAGIWEHSVVCTREEARQIAEGDIPRIRAFTVGSKTAPWYEWQDFNPYHHYMDAMAGDWRVNGVRAIACWMTLDQCHPELKGYYSGSFSDGDEEPAAQAEAMH